MATETQRIPTLQERIAALRLAQAATVDSHAGRQRPPAPKAPSPPPPALPQRSTTTPNLRQHNNVSPVKYEAAPVRAPGQQNRDNRPPALPPRRPSQLSAIESAPALPPRRPSEVSLARRPSAESVSSTLSVRSSVSTASGGTSFGEAPKYRIKAPEYNPSSLPALPERRAEAAAEKPARRIPLRTALSSPSELPGQDLVSQRLPPLPGRRQPPATDYERNESARQLPPDLDLHSSKAASAPAIPSNKPKVVIGRGEESVHPVRPCEMIVELSSDSFDELILRSGKAALVDFYAPFCKYCKELDPVYEQLAREFRHESVIFARIDSYQHKDIGQRYEVQGWPTIKWFDGSGGAPVDYQWTRDLEWMSKFIHERMAEEKSTSSQPPVPFRSKPSLADVMNLKPNFAGR